MPQLVLFDNPVSARTIETVRRGDLPGRPYAARVHEGRYYWLVGLFATREQAKAAATAFIRTPERFPEVVRKVYHPKHRGQSSRYLWVRKVKGPSSWQARPWLGAGLGDLNLGIYTEEEHGRDSEWVAGQVSRTFSDLWRPGVTVAEAVEALEQICRAKRWADYLPTIPDHKRALTPPTNNGPTETNAERRERVRALKLSHPQLFTAKSRKSRD